MARAERIASASAGAGRALDAYSTEAFLARLRDDVLPRLLV